MLVTTHTVAGAYLGRQCRTPAKALGAGIASHLALDAIPHWGNSTNRTWMTVAVLDGLAGLAALGLLAHAAHRTRQPRDVNALIGAIGGGLPDWDKPAQLFLRREIWPKSFNALHRGIQSEAPERLRREILIAAGALAALTPIVAARRASAR